MLSKSKIFRVKLNSAQITKKLLHSEYASDIDEYSDEEETKKKKKRAKNIREIIELVYLWKHLTSGVRSKVPNEEIKFRPKEAAELVGVPLKTMYDYMYSLKYSSHLTQDRKRI